MLRSLPDYQSDSEEEDNCQSNSKKVHKFERIKGFQFIDDARSFLSDNGYSYNYRVKENVVNNRKVKFCEIMHS